MAALRQASPHLKIAVRVDDATSMNDCDHAFGKYRYPADPKKTVVYTTSFLEQLSQGSHRKKLDMATIPESAEMAVQFARDCKCNILEIAVVGS